MMTLTKKHFYLNLIVQRMDQFIYRNGLLKTCKTFIIQLNLKFISVKFAMRRGHYQQKEKRKLLISAQGVHVTKMM